MSESTSGASNRLVKRKPSPDPADAIERGDRDTKRTKICLRAVVEASRRWRRDKSALGFPDETDKREGGSAYIEKATAPRFDFDDSENGDSDISESIAVKKYGNVDKDGHQVATFANELSILSELCDENIVEFIGFVENVEEGVAWILLRWADNGNLNEFIKLPGWEIPERLSLIDDVASGVEYLHSRDPPICHGDLKSLNVLVTSECRAVITDFGSARKVEPCPRETKTHGGGSALRAGLTVSPAQNGELLRVEVDKWGTSLTLKSGAYTLRWAAPEILQGQESSLASDMWAFSWICWEVMTREFPFHDVKKNPAVINRIVHGNLPPIATSKQISEVRVLCAMMTRCWAMDPNDRPAAEDFRSSLGSMQKIIPRRRQAAELGDYSLRLLCSLGYTESESYHYEAAKEHFGRAVITAWVDCDELEFANATMGEGVVLLKQGQYSKAEKALTIAMEVYASLGAQREVIDAAWHLGEAHFQKGEYLAAEAWYLEAKAVSTQCGLEYQVAYAMLGLGHVYTSCRDYCKAEQSYSQTKEIFERFGNKFGAAEAIRGLGRIYSGRHDSSKAAELWTKAKTIFASIGAEKAVAKILWLLGDTYLEKLVLEVVKARTSDVEARQISAHLGSQARALYKEAQEISTRIGDEAEAAKASFGSAEVDCLLGELDKGVESLEEAKKILVGLKDELGVASAIRRLATIYSFQAKHTEAEKAYGEAKEIYTRLGATRKAAEVTLSLGNLYHSKKNYEEAKRLYAEVKAIFKQLGQTHQCAAAALCLGEVYVSCDEYSEAEALCAEANEIYTRLEDKANIAKSFDLLGKIYRCCSQYDKAEEVQSKAKEIHASLGNERKVALSALCLGVTYSSQTKLSEAEASLKEALEFFERLGEEGIVAFTSFHLGNHYFNQREDSKAETFYNKCNNIWKKDICDSPEDEYIARTSWALGEIYLSRHEYSAAEASYMEARRIWKSLGYEQEDAYSSLGLGSVYLFQNKHSEAEEIYAEAWRIGQHFNVEVLLAGALLGFGEVYNYRKEYLNAEAFYLRAKNSYTHLELQGGVVDAILGLIRVYGSLGDRSRATTSFIEAWKILIAQGLVEEVE